MITRLLPLLCTGLLFAGLAAPALACTGDEAAGSCGAQRAQPRIIFGESAGTTFDFGDLRPLRRSAASTRQAYFGSGQLYSSTLAALQAQLQSMKQRYALEALPLTPAQEAAKTGMSPALMRALLLAKRAREGGGAAGAAD